MYVCVCKGLTQRDLQECLQDSSISSAEDVGKACGAGTDCGACRIKLERLLKPQLDVPFIPDQQLKKVAT